MKEEFRLHFLVDKLLKHYGCEEAPETYVEVLSNSMRPYTPSQAASFNAKRKIIEHSSRPDEFLRKLEELKKSNANRELLDAFVEFLSKTVEDKGLCDFLCRSNVGGHRERNESSNMSHSFRSSLHESILPVRSASTSVALEDSNVSEHATFITEAEVDEIQKRLLNITNQSSRGNLKENNSFIETSFNDLAVAAPESFGGVSFVDWNSERPFSTSAFVSKAKKSYSSEQKEPINLNKVPIATQEAVLIDNLLYVMMGVEGTYIRLKSKQAKGSKPGGHFGNVGTSHVTFELDSTIDTSFADLIERILPMCSDYAFLCRFVENNNDFCNGLVVHSLCSALRTVIKEYLVLCAQLETQYSSGELTLQNMWFYVQPCMKTMETARAIVERIVEKNARGGRALSVLYDMSLCMIVDDSSHTFANYLTASAAAPFLKMLQKWIYEGVVCDPYDEFLIEENKALSKENITEDYNDTYWEHRYILKSENCPVFLAKCSDKILHAGKYLNVIRECGMDASVPDAQIIAFSQHEREYVDVVEIAYSFSSKKLLDVLIKEKQLMEYLRSIKHYFLMDQGDLFVHFMDIAETELKKDVSDIIPNRLESLLELSLRTSVAVSDPFKDLLKCELLPYNLITQLFRIMNVSASLPESDPDHGAFSESQYDYALNSEESVSGLEAFTFSYTVKWPVSLVINKKSLTKYQLIFRHLFYSKHVERQLARSWVNFKRTSRYSVDAQKLLVGAFALRQRMLNFVQNIQYYMTFEVLEPSWRRFEETIHSVSTVDDVIRYHNDFLDTCLKECMLTNSQLLKLISKLFSICVIFSNYLDRFEKSIETGEANGDDDDKMYKSAHMEQLISEQGFERTISKFETNFASHLYSLLDGLYHYAAADVEHHMTNLVGRIDYNGFYSKYYKQEVENVAKTQNDINVLRNESYHVRTLKTHTPTTAP
eukprot:Nk52_evm45s252 gene=Nk52_evmTU45s252